jgi:hypothetical protein
MTTGMTAGVTSGGVGWFFLHGGRTAHALVVGSGSSTAVCGMSPAWWKPDRVWQGTVGTAGQEQAQRLPRCARCVRVLAARDSARRAAEARRAGKVRPGFFTPEVVEFYDWLQANGVDEWLPEHPRIHVGNGQLTYTAFRWEGERGWDLDAVWMPEGDGDVVVQMRTVRLRSPVTARVRELAGMLPLQLVEGDVEGDVG